MAHRIEGYDYFENDGQGDEDVFYQALCDGLVSEKEDVRFICGVLWRLHKEGKKPIIAIFLPEGDGMEVDQETGEIKESFVKMSEGMSTSLVDPSRDSQLLAILEQVASIERWANSIVVDSLESERKATDDAVIINDIKKKIELRRQELVKPYNDYVAHINGTVKALLSAPLNSADELVRGKILRFKQGQREKVDSARRENIAIVHEAMAKAEGKPLQLGELKPTGGEPQKTTRAELGANTMTQKRAWSFKEGLTHEQIMAGLPTQYKLANISLISDVIRKNKQLGEADFGGVLDIYLDDGLRITKRKPK